MAMYNIKPHFRAAKFCDVSLAIYGVPRVKIWVTLLCMNILNVNFCFQIAPLNGEVNTVQSILCFI
jgi:hypothetical protein